MNTTSDEAFEHRFEEILKGIPCPSCHAPRCPSYGTPTNNREKISGVSPVDPLFVIVVTAALFFVLPSFYSLLVMVLGTLITIVLLFMLMSLPSGLTERCGWCGKTDHDCKNCKMARKRSPLPKATAVKISMKQRKGL